MLSIYMLWMDSQFLRFIMTLKSPHLPSEELSNLESPAVRKTPPQAESERSAHETFDDLSEQSLNQEMEGDNPTWF